MTTPALHSCAICGRKAPAERLVFSRFTGSRYCRPADEDACARRAKRRAREEQRKVAVA